MPLDTFDGSFQPEPNDRRVIYACGKKEEAIKKKRLLLIPANPWLCDSRLEWFRQLLRDNLDIDIDKP